MLHYACELLMLHGNVSTGMDWISAPDDDPCGQTQPCQNGGTCVHTGAGQYQCVCSEEYEGENCTLARTDECNPNPCYGGGECIVSYLH